MREFIVGTWHFLQDAGWRGLFCEIFNIDSKHHEMYRQAYKDGMSRWYDKGGTNLDATILNLACNISDIEPFKNRRICQIRGYVAARNERLLRPQLNE